MSVRLTAAQAKALGIPTKGRTPRTTRKEDTTSQYRTRCMECSEVFTTIASEDRHLLATRHGRFEVLFDG